jgi:hypothetical protein
LPLFGLASAALLDDAHQSGKSSSDPDFLSSFLSVARRWRSSSYFIFVPLLGSPHRFGNLVPGIIDSVLPTVAA